jgi:hypothetical protein
MIKYSRSSVHCSSMITLSHSREFQDNAKDRPLDVASSVQGICPPLVGSAIFKRASSMPLAWASVTGKMTRSLRSSFQDLDVH